MTTLAVRLLSDPQTVNHPGIRERACVSSANAHTRKYIVQQDGVEWAFLSVDMEPAMGFVNPSKPAWLFVYDLWVPPELRHQGRGTRILREVVEQIAGEHEFSRVALRWGATETDRPLSDKEREDRLRFYRSLGYELSVHDASVMCKYVPA